MTRLRLLSMAVLASVPFAASLSQAAWPWEDKTLGPDQRAALMLKEMTEDEKLSLIFNFFASPDPEKSYLPPKESLMGSAGYTPGIARLGLPPQFETDAGIGVATQRASLEPYRQRTSLPSGLATAATWNTALAQQGGTMIGAEARESGFNIMLAGGINLVREPRNGRNFEYAGEDPLLAARMVAAQIKGIQSNQVISTIKHYAFNNQETGRNGGSANIAEDQARQSDLLAFELAIEESHPGSVMCSYNRYNGDYACENDFLLNQVLKRDWDFQGWVMSDWGGAHSTAKAIKAGLDQDSGWVFDKDPAFTPDKMKAALADGSVSRARLDDMVRRQLREMFAKGLIDNPPAQRPIDLDAHRAVAQADEEEAIVLLKNDGDLLPIGKAVKSIAVIGAHADKGVLSGGGSSTVFGVGVNAVPNEGPQTWPGPIVYHASPPLTALRKHLPQAKIAFDEGKEPAAAAKLAAQSDLVVMFVKQWTSEDLDQPIDLQDGQNELVAAVAKANPRIVVIAETGGPITMPWLDRVPAVLEAWYPGSGGGEAIARVLTGEVDASGRLPVTFPQSIQQMQRITLDGVGTKLYEPFDIAYSEGAAVGYKWFDRQNLAPLFPFGHGLSYGKFAFHDLSASRSGAGLSVSFAVENIGMRAAKAVPQIYLSCPDAGWEAPRRLGAFAKLALKPKEKRSVTLTVDPRLLAVFDSKATGWVVKGGACAVSLGASSRDLMQSVPVTLSETRFAANKVPAM